MGVITESCEIFWVGKGENEDFLGKNTKGLAPKTFQGMDVQPLDAELQSCIANRSKSTQIRILGSLEMFPTRVKEKRAGNESQHEKWPGWDPTCTFEMFLSLLLTPAFNPQPR